MVEKGSCDKIFINTSGIGEIVRAGLSTDRIRKGDLVLVSGPIGNHAISVLSEREGMKFKTKVRSDSAPLNRLISGALKASGGVRFMRDPTRGGVATTLNEIVEGRNFGISLEERNIPVAEGVREACEMLGFDPLYLACEGRVIIVAAKSDASKILRRIQNYKDGSGARVIGEVTGEYKGKVYLKTAAGGKRLVDMLSGEQLPRIC